MRLNILALVLMILCCLLMRFKVHAEDSKLDCVKVTKTLTICTRR